MKIVDKVWGQEKWIANNRLYCGKVLKLKEGFRCSIHQHKIKDETFYILSGVILLEFGKPDANGSIDFWQNKRIMESGDSQRIQPGTFHRFTGIVDSKIIEFSTHHEDDDSYRLTVSGKVPDDEMAKICEKAGVPF